MAVNVLLLVVVAMILCMHRELSSCISQSGRSCISIGCVAACGLFVRLLLYTLYTLYTLCARCARCALCSPSPRPRPARCCWPRADQLR